MESVESASDGTGGWWRDLSMQHFKYTETSNFEWVINPANSPWTQLQICLGVNKCCPADRSYKILTPNCLLIGRSLNKVPDNVVLLTIRHQ